MKYQTRTVTLATIFGVVVFLTKTIVPTPLDKMFIVVQAFLLGLASLLLRRMGATYVSVVGGFLTALWHVSFAPFSFLFAIVYGLSIDGFFLLFKVKQIDGKVKTSRSIVAVTVSTMLTGLMSYFTSVFLGLIPRNLPVEVIVLGTGIISGTIAGYFVSFIWNNHRTAFFK